MGESNKILDVTYGNFSCRLEGFDDTVETMKSVVGYFHDLAGHDLFTDQAPVVPDLDILARLTAQQTSGKVAIEESENGVSLRVMTEDQAADSEAEAADADSTLDDVAIEEETHENVFSEDVTEDDALMDEVEKTSFDDAVKDDTPEAPAFMDTTADADDTDGTDIEDDAGTDDFAVAAVATMDAPTLDEGETSAADRLQRIRAVVGRGAPPARDDTYAEDLTEGDVQETPKAVNPLAQRLAELAKRNSELMDADAQLEPPATAASEPLALGEEELITDEPDDAFEAIAEDNIATNDIVEDNGVGDDIAEDDSVEDDSVEEKMAQDTDAEDSEDAQDSDVDAARDVAAENVAPLRPERIEQPLLLTTRHQPITDADEEDEDEDFDLHEEVAKIEREIAARPGNELARHGLPRTVEDAMSRILMKTDLQLDLQETRDGRDAIAQLKAAVAATEAARQMGDSGAKSRDVSAMFRDDLGALEGTGGTDGTALPPLKLVEPVNEAPQSSLREVAPLTEAAARLREIAETTKAKSNEATAQTFADFARQQGAKDLVDKLEAAGAYLAFVAGEDDFSRPQVMKVVQSATDDEVTREDGLRSFGRLLRQSRIIKLNNGRFQIAENTRFKPSGNQAARY